MVDLDATHIDLDGTHENGAGGVGLNVRGNDETVLSATPMLELGTEFGNSRRHARSGLMCVAAPPSSTIRTSCCWRASKARRPASGPFRIAATTDDVVADLSAPASM